METTNSTFTYHRYSLTSAMYDAVGWVLTWRVNPTDLSLSYDSTIDNSTDAVYYDDNYSTFCGFTWHGSGGTTIGLAKCHSLASGGACDRHNVYFDTSATSGYSTDYRRALACHETGHVFGIRHTTGTTCMVTPLTATTAYSSHEVNDIINWVW